jgi:tRNA threonylcarbamoyladenosine biosynthesis protein TsaE
MVGERVLPVTIVCDSPAATLAFGARLGALLVCGDIVALQGELGTGKTQLAAGIAAGLGASEAVTSPTFVVIQHYHGRLPIHHADLYRLDDPVELAGIGLEELLDGDGVCLIEWPERAGERLPAEHLSIVCAWLGPAERAFTLGGTGPRARQIVAALAAVGC